MKNQPTIQNFKNVRQPQKLVTQSQIDHWALQGHPAMTGLSHRTFGMTTHFRSSISWLHRLGPMTGANAHHYQSQRLRQQWRLSIGSPQWRHLKEGIKDISSSPLSQEHPLRRRQWKGMGHCWKSFYEYQHTPPPLLAIPPTTLRMFCSDLPPLELRFWQQSGTIHPKRTKGVWPSQHFIPI